MGRVYYNEATMPGTKHCNKGYACLYIYVQFEIYAYIQ